MEYNTETINYSFAAAGWLKQYYFGVAKCLQENGMHKNARFVGSSAGSLVAVCLALDVDFDELRVIYALMDD
jgi:predicted acylesterase/phospholipase RssA